MSFLDYIDLDPHIHLFMLSKQNKEQTQQLIKQRIHHLLQTRKFDDLEKEAGKLKDLVFPGLDKRIADAKSLTNQEKGKLGDEQLEEKLGWLDAESNKDDADFQAVDDGQLKIFRLAKIYYDEGQYQKAYDIIKKLQKQLLNTQLYTKTTWARLYCQILLDTQKAKKTAQRLKSKLDEYQQKQKTDRKELKFQKYNESVKESYARRRQFIHLITIVYFLDSKDETFQKYVTYCGEEENSTVIQLLCPYVVRYLAVSLILNKALHKNRKFDLFTFVEAIRRKVFKYSDPFVDFLSSLYVEFDFEDAQSKIELIRKCVQEDVLLKPLESRIIQNCYFLFYKVYCKVYERVPISDIAKLTGKSEQEAELWILGFIRSLDIEAKIDSVQRVVLSYREQESLNEKYIDMIPKMNSFINLISQSGEQ